ncbi:cation transporting ATPase C-terminal domain-containing protein [Cryobacterium breve]|uniref:Cation transporting ATPase C-terminal domain-containing protein n=1 Tax=Cryobacterium breve TaxID=1259258 RepID=A0ABY7NG65_9MICO|nr:cation transporting ATPase C-terminal domain-containing protein [Cryobacterium breve]
MAEGRTIYRNITKGVLSCLTSNIAEFVVNTASLALASLFGVPLALNVLQILAIDLLGEIFPIAALGKDPAEGETMKDPPRDSRARILNGRSIVDVLWCGSLIGVFAMVNYLVFFSRNGIDPFSQPVPAVLLAEAMSTTYVTIMVCQLVSIIQRRSVHGFFTRYQFANPSFWYAVSLAVTIMLVIVYVPLVAGFFGTSGLGVLDWAFVLGAAVLFLGVREGAAALRRRGASAPAGRA